MDPWRKGPLRNSCAIGHPRTFRRSFWGLTGMPPRTWRCLVSTPTTPFNSMPSPKPAPVTTRMRDPSNSGLGGLWRLAVTELGSVYTAVPAIADKRTHAFVRVRECKFSSSAESPSDSLIPRSLSSKKQLVKKGEKISKTSGICFLSQQIDLRLTRQIF